MFVLIFIIHIWNTSAFWYQNVPAPSSWNPDSWATYCTTDGDIADLPAVADNNSTTSLIPESSQFPVPTSGTLNCLHWDASPAIVNTGSLTYTNGWTNSWSHIVTATLSDSGGSSLYRYQISYRTATDTPNFVSWSPTWTNVAPQIIPGGVNLYTVNDSFTLNNNTAYEYRIRVQDDATYKDDPNNWSAWTYPAPAITLMVDRDPPLAADISPFTNQNLLAVTSQDFSIDVGIGSPGGSPIVRIDGNFNGGTNSIAVSPPWSQFRDISAVDPLPSGPVLGGREHYVDITRIEDQAGNVTNFLSTPNCWTAWTPTSHLCFYAFANTTSGTMNATAVDLNTALSSWTNVADGNPITWNIRLEDQFGNDIVYAPSISRTVNFNVLINNNLRRDQYNNAWTDSALYFPSPTNAVPVVSSTNQSYNNRQSNSRDYPIPFYIYAPTNTLDWLTPGSASITDITFDVNGSLWAVWWQLIASATVPNIRARPLFTASFSWEIATQGFIEWADQISSLDIVKNSPVTTNGESLRLEYGEVGPSPGNVKAVNAQYNMTIGGASLNEWPQSNYLWVSQIASPIASTTLNSFMIQDQIVPNLRNSYLASLIQYDIWWRTIAYPHAILGKSTYHNGWATLNSTQAAVKILWNVSSQQTQALVNTQFTNDVRILGKLTKSVFRKDIEQKVYSVTKNISPSNGARNITSVWQASWGNSWWGVRALNNSVLYFGNMWWGNVTLNGDNNIEW